MVCLCCHWFAWNEKPTFYREIGSRDWISMVVVYTNIAVCIPLISYRSDGHLRFRDKRK